VSDWGKSKRGTVSHLLGEPVKGPLFGSRCRPRVLLRPVAGLPVRKCSRCIRLESAQPALRVPREALVELLGFVDRFRIEHGFGPTARELYQGLGLSSSSVGWWRARAAARLAWLEWEPGKARTMRLTAAGKAMIRGNGQDLAAWLLRLEHLVAELDGCQRVKLEVLVRLSGSIIPLARFETKGGSLAEEEG